MTQSIKVALAQLNPKVGDVLGNLAKVRAARAEAAKQGADLVLTAELVLAGYFPEDLVLKPSFVKRCHEAVEALRADTRDGGPALFVATPWHEDGKLYNAIICLDKGEIVETGTHAELLAKDGVFAKLVETQTHINEIIGYSG